MRRASAAEAVADVAICCFLGAMWAGNAASNLMLLTCYAIGFVRDVFRETPFRTKSFLILMKVHRANPCGSH
jgi:hypothetical protein